MIPHLLISKKASARRKGQGPRAQAVLFAGLAVAALLLMGLPSMADAPQAAPEVAAKSACSPPPEAHGLQSVHQRLLQRLKGEPGFVDVLVHDEPGAPGLTVLIDEQATGAIPVLPQTIDGIAVQVITESFLPLPQAQQALGIETEAVVPGPCPQEIRPGARMTSPAGCTFSFIFKDQYDRFYVATAGHCVDAVGDRVSAAGIGPIGTVVYLIDEGVGRDFAMIRIDPDKENLVNPAMCHWGGPTGTALGTSTIIHHYGWGIGFGTAPETRARSGALSTVGGSVGGWKGTAAPGDSGSGAITSNGDAFLTITHIGLNNANTVFGTRINQGINLAQQSTGLTFTLQTAPMEATGPLDKAAQPDDLSLPPMAMSPLAQRATATDGL
jgi:hypothetical protein